MPLTWDIREVKDHDDLFITNEEGEKELNVLTSTLIHMTIDVGINHITEKTYKAFYIRGKELEVAYGGGYIRNTKDGSTRMPLLPEVQAHIGLKTNATLLTNRKWSGRVRNHVGYTAKEMMDKEKEDAVSKV
tara:strand:+ start:936 stop:1331 length:396 start_codon:yes stop_codon:yes gene_type:complete